jgi:hypothetical protein
MSVARLGVIAASVLVGLTGIAAPAARGAVPPEPGFVAAGRVEGLTAASLTYAIDVDTGASAQVGETITLTPQVIGSDIVDARRCVMYVESTSNPVAFVRMQVAGDDCVPWTVTVPAASEGTYRVAGYLMTDVGGTRTYEPAPETSLEITSGTAVPFVTNYPVQSWAASDLLSDPAPAFGSPFTVDAPAGLAGCRISVFAGMESATTYQAGDCVDWTLTVPAPTPDVVASIFGDRADVRIVGWEGVSDWTETNPDLPYLGARYGETYNAAIPTFSGTVAGSYASSLPAIFTGPARGNVYYGDDPTDHDFVPVIIGATDGSCESDRAPLTRPVVAGACEPFTVPQTQFAGSVGEVFRLRLLDDGGTLIAEASTDIGFVDRMDDVVVVVTPETPVGEPVDIDASTDAGAPASYEIVVTPVSQATGAGLAPATSAGTTYQGSFSPTVGTDGDQVLVSATGLAAGDWDVRSTFTDVLGSTSTSTKRIKVTGTDSTPPSGTISIAGGASITRTRAVTVSTAATDTGTGMSQVGLSHDGVTWSYRAYAPTQSITLPATNGTRRVYAKWQDKAGNWSAVKSDTIVLDTVAPTVTAPRRGFVPGTAIVDGAIQTRIPWSGTDATSGIARYELAQQTDGEAWTTVSSTLTATTINRLLATEHTYAFRVRAIDRAGNVGAWATGATFRISRKSETHSSVTYTGTWTLSKSPVFWGGQAMASNSVGARASITFTGRSIAWVASTGPTRGKAEIYVDGIRVATVDLYAATSAHQKVVWASSWTTATSRTIRVRVLGTSGRPRVDLDAFVTAN